MTITFKRLDSGYIRAQGNGPCEWAQWPENRMPDGRDFFPEASAKFADELFQQLKLLGETRAASESQREEKS